MPKQYDRDICLEFGGIGVKYKYVIFRAEEIEKDVFNINISVQDTYKEDLEVWEKLDLSDDNLIQKLYNLQYRCVFNLVEYKQKKIKINTLNVYKDIQECIDTKVKKK